jgi:hypothetical protein
MTGGSGKHGKTLPAGVAFEVEADAIPFATSGVDCPSIYADHIRGTMIMGETTKIILVENRQNALTETVQAVHVAQLVIPTTQLRAWGEYFTQIANHAGLVTNGNTQAPESDAKA